MENETVIRMLVVFSENRRNVEWNIINIHIIRILIVFLIVAECRMGMGVVAIPHESLI